MKGKKRTAESNEAIESYATHFDVMGKLYADIEDDKAKQKARDESLRIALVTNEINAGRVSEIAGLYREYLIKPVTDLLDGSQRYRCPSYRIKALEHAASIGYVSAEETVEAAREFEKHLSGQNERSES